MEFLPNQDTKIDTNQKIGQRTFSSTYFSIRTINCDRLDIKSPLMESK